MALMRHVVLTTFLLSLVVVKTAPTPTTTSFDVIVYGATPAGILAALAAAGEGNTTVALLDPRSWIGGAMTGGLAITDIGTTTAVIGGRTRKFFETVTSHYASPKPLYDFEPHIAEKIFWFLLNATNISVQLNTRITSLTKGADSPSRITTATTASSSNALSARVWIDTSYEGFLLPLANVSFTYGRESTSTYNETIAGVLPVPHPFPTADKPFVAQPQVWAGVNGRASDGSLLPGVSSTPPGPIGSGDVSIQAYSYRTTFTNNRSNILRPWPKPANYNASLYALALNAILYFNLTTMNSVVWFGALLPCVGVVNCSSTKGDSNNHKFGQFYLANSYPLAVATNNWAAQNAVWDDYRTAQLGLYYFLANDISVPQSIRDSANTDFGLPLDEHIACGHFPCQLYVREALRMVSDFVLTQDDIFNDISQPDSIGRGAYSVDVMHSSIFYTPNGTTTTATTTGGSGDGGILTVEAGMQAPSFLNKSIAPFQIPYRSLLPRRMEATNLLVPVALSSSHVGFNAVRLEPTWMTLGESAGVAAAMAVREDINVQDVDIMELQARLWQLGQIL